MSKRQRTPVFIVEDIDDGVVRVSGVLDLANARALDQRLSEEDCPMHLDLSGVEFMDGAAVHVLLAHRERCTGRGQDFQLLAVSPSVERVLDHAGMRPMFLTEQLR